MAKRSTLTPQQRRFTEIYLVNGRNAVAAYRSAYPGNASEKTAKAEAHRLLNHPYIAPAIEEADARARARLDARAETYAISKERISQELAGIAFDTSGEMKASDRRQALMDLAKLHGHIVEKRKRTVSPAWRW